MTSPVSGYKNGGYTHVGSATTGLGGIPRTALKDCQIIPQGGQFDGVDVEDLVIRIPAMSPTLATEKFAKFSSPLLSSRLSYTSPKDQYKSQSPIATANEQTRA